MHGPTSTTRLKENQDWGMVNGQGYILNREHSHAALSRVNCHVYLRTSALKLNVHPSTSSTLPEAPTIANVVPETCTWLIEVAQELPKAQQTA
jgi:hypothetical protein